MPFQSETYRVLIASPSDLAEERQVATDVINDWNALHAAAEKTVLLPLKWETHAVPTSGIRPQGAINAQLVANADMLIGMFWTKLGTSTGVAASGTVEEIDQLVAAGKPAMLYFSSRPIDPNRIDLAQQAALRDFKTETYSTALVGGFATTMELHTALMRDLTNQVRALRAGRRVRRGGKIDETERLVEMMVSFKKAKITPAEFHQFRDELLPPKKPPQPVAVGPIKPGELGPNGHPVGYTKKGDLVEHIPKDEFDEAWELLLRRNDNAIHDAIDEFMTAIWYDRKLVMFSKIEAGEETIEPAQRVRVLEAMAAAEKKYGKRKIRNYYKDTFGWGMLNGKLSALRWVMGDEWDMLDT